jgi:hypothetical protein
VTTIYVGKAGRAWDSLHPSHQTTVARSRYVACERLAPLEGDVRQIDVLRGQREPWTVPGQEGQVDSTAVTIRVLLALPGLGSPQPVTHTAHVFRSTAAGRG